MNRGQCQPPGHGVADMRIFSSSSDVSVGVRRARRRLAPTAQRTAVGDKRSTELRRRRRRFLFDSLETDLVRLPATRLPSDQDPCAMTTSNEVWAVGSACEPDIGRWSCLVPREFLTWLSPQPWRATWTCQRAFAISRTNGSRSRVVRVLLQRTRCHSQQTNGRSFAIDCARNSRRRPTARLSSSLVRGPSAALERRSSDGALGAH